MSNRKTRTTTVKNYEQDKMQKCICILCPHSAVCALKNAVDHTDPNSFCEVQLKDYLIGPNNTDVIYLYEVLWN